MAGCYDRDPTASRSARVTAVCVQDDTPGVVPAETASCNRNSHQSTAMYFASVYSSIP